MEKINIEELRNIQIEILDVVSEYCKKNKIKYFLCGGTLIGAVRHQGYIPWDDDIDIALLREDYERFTKNFNNSTTLYKVYDSNNTSNFPYPFAKVSFERSVLKEHIDQMSYSMGINIDIFPIDTLPDKKEYYRKILRNINKHRRVLNVKLIKIKDGRAFYKNVILFLGKLFYKYKTIESIVASIQRVAMQYKKIKTNTSGIIVWGYGEREIVSKNLFEEVVALEFEGKYYDVPIGYHQWLTSVYGDYMKLPPKEKQVSHHAFDAFLKD